ncbi:MAG: hypothetical protein MUF45_04770 [Spirosomaceae bacterium]|jgi:hypothetical protein|nr:hypothetical protein [Spirosomataceae bacterium]
MKIKQILVLTFIVALGLSCKDKEEVSAKTKLELLTGTNSKKWKVSSAIAKSGTLELNLTATQPTCRVDNTLILFANKTYELREGTTKCASNDPDLLVKASWNISADETTLTIDKLILLGVEFNQAVIKITELTENSLKGETNITFNGQQYTLVASFVPAN